MLLKGADCRDLCPCYAVSDGESGDGRWTLDMGNGLLLLNVLKFASQQEWMKDVGNMSALGLGFWLGFWCWCWCWSRGELLHDMVSISEEFNRARGVCVMKCSDCMMVWKKCGITSGDEMVVIMGEIFGIVTLSVGKYAKSGMFVGVKMFATGGWGTTNSSVCGVYPTGDIVGDILG